MIELIAEIGINHNGDMAIAKRLIDCVSAAGWHVAKFQKRTPALCVPEAQKNQPKSTPWGEMTYLEYKERIEFDQAEYDTINAYCIDKPMLWTASVWDIPSLYFVLQYPVPFIKIPSAKITDLALLEACAKSGRPLYISTGMSTEAEIDQAVGCVRTHSDAPLTLFHTNSTYPCPNDELNLRLIPWLRDRYGCRVGYSGHEADLEPSVMAVAMGAEVIERHITLDKRMWGSDQSASLTVDMMEMLRRRIDGIPGMLGDGVKRVYAGEESAKAKLR